MRKWAIFSMLIRPRSMRNAWVHRIAQSGLILLDPLGSIRINLLQLFLIVFVTMSNDERYLYGWTRLWMWFSAGWPSITMRFKSSEVVDWSHGNVDYTAGLVLRWLFQYFWICFGRSLSIEPVTIAGRFCVHAKTPCRSLHLVYEADRLCTSLAECSVIHCLKDVLLLACTV